jgi:hypothetical protein
MTNIQRLQNAISKIDSREIADKTMINHRIRNDKLTLSRRFKADILKKASKGIINNRIRNDQTTIEKRLKADKALDNHRLRNDEITFNRSQTKDTYFEIIPFHNNPWSIFN